MAFRKAQDLIELALMAAARRGGVSLEDIIETFGVSHRTAQRMTEALAATFANVTAEDGPDRKRRWRVEDGRLARLVTRQETVIEALEIAARDAREDNRLRHARALDTVREDLIARMTPRDALRAEADAEAVLAALGHVVRPGPRVRLDAAVLDALIEALRGPFRLQVVYGEPDAALRVLEPHGVLLGPRSYIVVREERRTYAATVWPASRRWMIAATVRRISAAKSGALWTRRAKRRLNQARSRRQLWPMAQRMALTASPSGPWRWFRSSRPSAFMWPSTGSMPFRRRISRRMVGEVTPRVWETTTCRLSRSTP
jgi:hypothetical protein